MDDGSIQNKGLHLNTYAFKSEDVLKLKSTLENMFGNNSLKCSIHKHKKLSPTTATIGTIGR